MEWLQLIFSPAIDLVKWVSRKLEKPDPQKILQYRQKLRDEFMDKLSPEDKYGTHGEAIVRDLKRMDVYPELSPSRGISPWFKVEIKGLYHRGLEVFLSMPSRVIFDEAKEVCRE